MELKITSVSRKCQSCERQITASVGQETIDGRILWYESYSCPYCGYRLEVDGKDDTPDDIREAILAEEGEWALDVLETGPQAILALKVLRDALGLSLNEAKEVKDKMPGIVAVGTQAEMERLRYLLSFRKLQSSVAKVSRKQDD